MKQKWPGVGGRGGHSGQSEYQQDKTTLTPSRLCCDDHYLNVNDDDDCDGDDNDDEF